MSVIPSGSTIDRNPDEENVLEPMLVTPAGNVNEVKLVQKKYLQPVITQYFVSYKSEIWA